MTVRRTRTSKPTFDRRQHAIANGYRSGLEESIADDLRARGVAFTFEKLKVEYRVDKTSKYTPDFQLPNGIIVESKGRFVAADRVKHLLVKAQHPHLDIRFLFQRPNTRLSKTSTTTYAAWAEKNGFKWCALRVPDAWIQEKT